MYYFSTVPGTNQQKQQQQQQQQQIPSLVYASITKNRREANIIPSPSNEAMWSLSFTTLLPCLLIILLSFILNPNVVHSLEIPHQFESDDYYKVLGLNKHNNTPSKEIKKSYHRLALQYHPDKVKHQSDSEEKQVAETIFVKISEAYDVLGDERLRSIYDRYGKNGLEVHKRGMDPEAAGFGRGKRYYSHRNSDGSSSNRQGQRPGGSPTSFKFKFNDGFDPFETQESPGKNKQSNGHSRHFHFSSGGKTWTTNDWESSSNSPFGMLILIALFSFMIFIALFIIILILAITFFPITLYLIWRCVRKR